MFVDNSLYHLGKPSQLLILIKKYNENVFLIHYVHKNLYWFYKICFEICIYFFVYWLVLNLFCIILLTLIQILLYHFNNCLLLAKKCTRLVLSKRLTYQLVFTYQHLKKTYQILLLYQYLHLLYGLDFCKNKTSVF